MTFMPVAEPAPHWTDPRTRDPKWEAVVAGFTGRVNTLRNIWERSSEILGPSERDVWRRRVKWEMDQLESRWAPPKDVTEG